MKKRDKHDNISDRIAKKMIESGICDDILTDFDCCDHAIKLGTMELKDLNDCCLRFMLTFGGE